MANVRVIVVESQVAGMERDELELIVPPRSCRLCVAFES